MPHTDDLRGDLIRVSGAAADFEHMVLFGEGNVSARIDDDRFLVKASGTQLSSLEKHHLVEVHFAPLLDALDDERAAGDADVERLLMSARVDDEALKPSVETLFHAWLLKLGGVRYVGHAHPVAVNQLLCSTQAQAFATERLFPDQIVYCGEASVLVPYVDPGLVLARTIAEHVTTFVAERGFTPKTILLENHGLIALGSSPEDMLAALVMTEKSARVFAGAARAGGPRFMPAHHVARIAGRGDEHYRRQMLGKMNKRSP